ncbi:unnamed protein product [Caenorhabditis brenneri]
MRSVVIALLLSVALSRSDFLLPFQLSDDLINYTAKLEQPINNETICQFTQLNFCQNAFNNYLGINTSLTYRNGTNLFNSIQSLLNLNVTELNKVCQARTNFYHCLGQSYYACMNLHTRLENDAANAFDYVRSFRGLEWICGGGFRESVGQYDCLEGIPTTNTYQSCINYFHQTVYTGNFCPSIQLTGDCLNDGYKSVCGDNAAGHYGCESFRYVFHRACAGLQCTRVN